MNNVQITLKDIFDKNMDKKICVLGTTCCGKSTLCKLIPNTIDMDEALWPTLNEMEEQYICQKPWTKDIGEFTRNLVRQRVTIKPGYPLFSLILVECDLIVYLDICDEILYKHCQKRGASFNDAKNVKDAIENTINSKVVEQEIKLITLEIK